HLGGWALRRDLLHPAPRLEAGDLRTDPGSRRPPHPSGECPMAPRRLTDERRAPRNGDPVRRDLQERRVRYCGFPRHPRSALLRGVTTASEARTRATIGGSSTSRSQRRVRELARLSAMSRPGYFRDQREI